MNKYILDLDEFTIIRKLGKGRYGEVFLVEHNSTKKQYAAKISLNDCIKKHDQKKFFIEVDTFANTKNPAVLGFLGFSLSNFKSEPNPTIIVDYIPNGSLYAILEKCRFFTAPNEWNDTKKYINLLGIALGMKYLHSQKIVQRDLKPQNILLDENYYPHISDFGCSKFLDELNSQNFMNSETGTLLYMAPEILTGSDYTYKVDIYSYSLIAYEIITSEKIIPKGENPMSFIHKVSEGKRPDISKICDENQVKLLKRCWANDPHERPTFSEIVDNLKEWNFVSSFGIINEEEVNEYLALFPDEKQIGKPKETVKKSNETRVIKIPRSNHISDLIFRIVLIGDSCTKKSELIKSFIYDKNTTCIDNDLHTKKIQVNDSIFQLQVWDTVENERFRSLIPLYLKNSSGNLIIANAGVEGQFESLQRWFSDVKEIDEKAPIFIVATNSCSENAVNTQRFHEFADQNGCPFYEISNDMSNVNEVFTQIAVNVYNKYRQGPTELLITENNNKHCVIY